MVDDIERRVTGLIAGRKKLDPATVTMDSTFDELGVDSLDAADLLFTVEDAFGIVVPDETAQAMKSVRQIVDDLRQRLAAQAGAE